MNIKRAIYVYINRYIRIDDMQIKNIYEIIFKISHIMN